MKVVAVAFIALSSVAVLMFVRGPGQEEPYVAFVFSEMEGRSPVESPLLVAPKAQSGGDIERRAVVQGDKFPNQSAERTTSCSSEDPRPENRLGAIQGEILTGLADSEERRYVGRIGIEIASPDRKRIRSYTWSSGDTTYIIDKVPAGLYEVVFDLFRERRIAVVENVIVKPGETTHEPRLTIDLRGVLRRFQAPVFDAAGIALEAVRYRYRTAELPPDKWIRRVDSSVDVITTADWIEVLIDADGCRVLELPWFTGSEAVFLEPGLPVSVVASDLRAIPSPPYHLGIAAFTHSLGPGRSLFAGPAYFDSFGEANLIVGAPGTYEVFLWIAQEDSLGEPIGPNLSEGTVRGGELQTVTISDTRSEQVREIDIPPADVHVIVERLSLNEGTSR